MSEYESFIQFLKSFDDDKGILSEKDKNTFLEALKEEKIKIEYENDEEKIKISDKVIEDEFFKSFCDSKVLSEIDIKSFLQAVNECGIDFEEEQLILKKSRNS